MIPDINTVRRITTYYQTHDNLDGFKILPKNDLVIGNIFLQATKGNYSTCLERKQFNLIFLAELRECGFIVEECDDVITIRWDE